MRQPIRDMAVRSVQINRGWTSTLTPFLTPCLLQDRSRPSISRRAVSILSSLSDNPSAYNKEIRRGQGPSSGKGKTSGRGHKGQKQHGKVPAGFEGGQTPLAIVKGERGFENPFSAELSVLNLDKLQDWIDLGRLDPAKPITIKELNDSGCVTGIKDGVKLLAKGKEQLRTGVHIVVSRASATAIAAVERAGGSVTTRYYSAASVRIVLKGLADPIISLLMRRGLLARRSEASAGEQDSAIEDDGRETEDVPSLPMKFLEEAKQYRCRLADPTRRKDFEYYRDPAHRGYLSWMVGPEETPSLFYRTIKVAKEGALVKKSKVPDNRMW